MPDLLIKLYELPFEKYQKEHFDCESKIVRPLSIDKSKVIEFVRKEFNESWANEYGYAIVGWVDENQIEFYKKNTLAAVIPGSSPGIYKRMVEKVFPYESNRHHSSRC